MAGLEAAATVVSAVEIDVRASADGELVMSHDPELGGLVIAESSWAQLAQVDLGGGHHPILLGDALAAFPEMTFDIEVKNWPGDPGFEPDSVTALRSAELARPIDYLTCFYWPTVDAVKVAFPELRTGLLLDKGGSLSDTIDHARRQGHEIIAPHWSLIHEPLPDDLVAASWTVNDPEMARTLAGFGVSTVITDDPGMMVQALQTNEDQ